MDTNDNRPSVEDIVNVALEWAMDCGFIHNDPDHLGRDEDLRARLIQACLRKPSSDQ